jgi:eukaryotic-like serine/threonine-protein kinase
MQSQLTMSEHEDRASGPLPTSSVRAGQIFGRRYRVLSSLGSGGMGEVYVVEHLGLGCRMALKILRPALQGTVAAMQRFQQEARLGGLLQHPNLVRVFDLDVEGRTEFLVMELLEGVDLKTLLGQLGRLPVDRGVRLMRDALAGMGAAHQHGIVHRDLKPANLFVVESEAGERCKLLDFGVAKLRGQSTQSCEALTASGTPLGTLAYMAPEQIRGARDIDARADIYSASAILFEMLSGRRLFEAESAPEQIFRILHERAPRLDSQCPSCPRELANIVDRGLSADRMERFQNASEFAASLEPFLVVDAGRHVADVSLQGAANHWGARSLSFAACIGMLVGYLLGAERLGGPAPADASSLAREPAQLPSNQLPTPTVALPEAPASPTQSSAVVPVVTTSSVPAAGRTQAPRSAKVPALLPPLPSVHLAPPLPSVDVERSNPYH